MGKIENGLNAVENFLSTTQEMQDTVQEIYGAARDTYDTVQNTTNTFNHVVDYNTSEDWKAEMAKYDRLIERCKNYYSLHFIYCSYDIDMHICMNLSIRYRLILGRIVN